MATPAKGDQSLNAGSDFREGDRVVTCHTSCTEGFRKTQNPAGVGKSLANGTALNKTLKRTTKSRRRSQMEEVGLILLFAVDGVSLVQDGRQRPDLATESVGQNDFLIGDLRQGE
jgi:hypothetical protein